MSIVFDPELMELITKIDESITDVAVDIVNIVKKNKKSIKDLDEKRGFYFDLKFSLGNLEKIGLMTCDEGDKNMIPKIIENSKKVLEKFKNKKHYHQNK